MPDVRDQVVSILTKLEEEALFALARTVTQGLKRNYTSQEAIENIIKYSPDELSILRRKVVTREILFNYLEDCNVKVRLPITKNELIDVIVDKWNLSRISAPGQTNNVLTNNGNGTEVARSSHSDTSVNQMAEQFAKWFFSMLNQNQCGPEHFFLDARLKLNMYTNSDCNTTVIESDPEEIGKTLLKTKSDHDLYFNPNDSKEGIQGRMDPHGLVMVLTCGTLHVQNICVGVFEQIFALARDPFSDNNWKIKNTELNLRSRNNILDSPRLCDSELTSELLSLPAE